MNRIGNYLGPMFIVKRLPSRSCHTAVILKQSHGNLTQTLPIQNTTEHRKDWLQGPAELVAASLMALSNRTTWPSVTACQGHFRHFSQSALFVSMSQSMGKQTRAGSDETP